VAEQHPLDEDPITQFNQREEILLRIRKLAQEIEDKVRRLVTTADEIALQRRSRLRLTELGERSDRREELPRR
jgi:hypothetical protein